MKKLSAILFLLLPLLLLFSGLVQAATPNPSPNSPGYMVLPLNFSRTVTTVSTPVIARIRLPFPAAVVSVTAVGETADYASGDEVYTVDVKESGTSILSAPIGLAAAGTVYQGTVSDKTLADESVLTVVLAVTGTTPSITDVTTLLVLKRL